MPRRNMCASIDVLLLYVSLLVLCALCSAETERNEIDGPISSVRRLLAADLTMFISGGVNGQTAVTVPSHGTVKDLVIAAAPHIDLSSQRLLTERGEELLADDNTALSDAGIGAEATLIVADIDRVKLTFTPMCPHKKLRSANSDDSDSGFFTMYLPLNRPIFNEFRKELNTKYNLADDSYDLVINLNGCTGDSHYYSDLRLVRLKDFRRIGGDDEWEMINFSDDVFHLRNTLLHERVHEYVAGGFLIQLEIPIAYNDLILPNFAFVYKSRKHTAYYGQYDSAVLDLVEFADV